MSENIVYQPSITTHWKNLFEKKSMLLGSHNLNPGEELVLQIQSVSIQKIKNQNGKDESVPVVQFVNANPMVLNITNARMLASLYGELHECWVGRYIQLYSADIKVKGEAMTALRIRPKVPSVGVNFDAEENALRNCKTLKELQGVFLKLPAQAKSMLANVKDEMKAKLK
ncbi:coil containing protein [Vibrio phage 1.052.A._10N.286.46.C3]|nr:coil containing protein [Vibrio phage 1.052.A._10N.286.46.C3]